MTVDADRTDEHARQGRALLRAAAVTRWRGLLAGTVAGLLWTAGKVSVPWVLGAAIDEGITGGEHDRVWWWAGAVLVAGVVAGVFTGARRWIAFRESRRIEQLLRDRFIAHTQHLDLGFHDRTSPGELMSRAHSDLQHIQNLLVLIPLLASSFATVIAVTAILLSTDAVLALLAMVPLVLLQVPTRLFARRVHPVALEGQRHNAAFSSVVEESISGVRLVKGLGLEQRQQDLLEVRAERLYDNAMRSARLHARFLPVIDQIPAISMLLVLAVGGAQVIDGHLTLGSLVAFTVYVGMLLGPARMLGMIVAQAQPAIASAGRVAEVLGTDPAVADPADPVPLPSWEPGRPGARPAGAIRFESVGFSYGDGEEGSAAVLDGFDLAVEAGETIALVGGTGSGKTTAVRLLARFHDVAEGSITIDGVDIRRVRLRELRRAIGFVFEDTFLFNDTVAANIAFAHPEAEPADIERAARLAGAHDFVTALPDGYDTVVGERGHLLSGGQRQRLTIARAVLADPRILILDDATSAVDAAKEREIREAVVELLGRRTTIVIAHRPATIALADRVVFVVDGRVADTGPHPALVERNSAYRATLGLELVDAP